MFSDNGGPSQLEHYVQESRRLSALVVAERRRSEWMLHNAGLINDWALLWNPARHPPLIDWLRQRIDDAMTREAAK